MIIIIDYGLGNIKAFSNIYGKLGIACAVARHPEELALASRVILPGVGAFDQAMQRLTTSGMRGALDELAFRRRVPILGICVGMQILAKRSEEGASPGLGWLDADVQKFDTRAQGGALRVPHMGWNDVQPVDGSGLFNGLESGARFYFLHSYYFKCDQPRDVLARAEYGAAFACAVRRGNIYGVQFHPEKSHRFGIRLLKNFAEL